MREGYGKQKFVEMFVFPLLAREFTEEKKGDSWKRIDLCRDR